MRIVTLVKYVPDATGERTFEADKTVDRESDGLLSELDEYAIEEALDITESDKKSEVIALTVGPSDAIDAVRKALQMGAHKGYHVCDDALAATDALGTSQVLAAAVRKIIADEGPVDLVLTGLSSTDGQMSVIPVQVAELLDWPAATQASHVEAGDQSVTVRRDGDTSSQFVEVAYPAVISVTDQINEPRYPSFKGIIKAKGRPKTELDLSDLGLDPAQVGGALTTTVVTIDQRPARTAGEVITDEGQGGQHIADWLSAQKLV